MKVILIHRCVACGDPFGRTRGGSGGGMKFCDRDCFLLHMQLQHERHGAKRWRWADLSPERRRRILQQHRSPAKTVREDLAWMYDEMAAERGIEYRNHGGAHTRAVRRRNRRLT